MQQVRRANPGAKLIVFVTAGRALHIPREVEEAADAIFWTAHLGSFAGDAIADILAGVASPTARLSHGLPIADGITSGFDTAAGADRPAGGAGGAGLGVAAPAPPLVRLLPRPRRPLAGGLLLRRRLRLHLLRALRLVARATARSRPRPARRVTASVRVTNTGSRAGTETVHLYYQDMVCEERVPRLLERLGHRQVTLAPGESATLTFTVTPEMLAKYGRDPEAGRRVWPDRNPAENPDRLFLVQHEGQALDAIERFGDAPCVLSFTAGAVEEAGDDDLGVSARRPEQHGQPRRRRRLRPAGRTRVRFVTQEGRLVRAGGRDRLRRGQRRAGPEAAGGDHRLLASLIPFARKARTHSEAQVALIAGSIREYGFTNPVLVDGESGIIAGHGRVLAARKLGLG